MSHVMLLNSSLWQRLTSGVGVRVFNFSDVKPLCFREKFNKGNWTDYQHELGPLPRPMSPSLCNRLDSNTNLLKENGTVPDMK